MISRRLGGDQIRLRRRETPTVRKMFTDELAKNGPTPRMDQAYAQEPPTCRHRFRAFERSQDVT